MNHQPLTSTRGKTTRSLPALVCAYRHTFMTQSRAIQAHVVFNRINILFYARFIRRASLLCFDAAISRSCRHFLGGPGTIHLGPRITTFAHSHSCIYLTAVWRAKDIGLLHGCSHGNAPAVRRRRALHGLAATVGHTSHVKL